jgi:hypothetical protein
MLARKLHGLCEAMGSFVGEKYADWDKRLAALEARDWVGTWEQGKAYARGAVISHDGIAWTSTRPYPEGKPGTPNSGWKLFVKKGLDGKDGAK